MLSSIFPRAHARYASLPILGGNLEGLCEWLAANGYPPDAIRRRIAAARFLEDLLRRRDVKRLADFTAAELLSFAPEPTRWTAQTVGSLIRSLTRYLGERGELAPAPSKLIVQRVEEYERYLAETRGLAPSTVSGEGIRVTEFLRFLGHEENPGRLHDLGPGDIDAFLTKMGRRLGRPTMQKITGTLRGFVRFLSVRGELPPGLDAHIDSPRVHRGERLPRSLPWETVRALLNSIDRATPKGLRDYSMFLLVATYGLRSGEVVALKLDDIAWRTRTIRVPRPKIGTPLLLPLTDEVASALLDYLRRGRRASSHRSLFFNVRAPWGPITSDTVSDAFDAWARRAGVRLPLRAGGPHCLRHSLAEHLLRRGASLKTIGDLLGHRSTESTCVYLRLKVEDLRDVALPLPTTATARVRP